MKKKYLYLLFFIFFAVISCDKLGENPVYGSVYLRLDLLNRDKILRDIGECKTFLYSRPGVDYNPQQGERLGLGGIVVVHTPLDEYCAFDLACPNEQTPNSNTIIEVEKDRINAVCPKCGTKYQIMNGTGIALEGKKYGLRSYRVTISGNAGIVAN